MLRASILALCALLSPACAALAGEPLAAGKDVTVAITPGTPAELRIEAPPGSYVAGRIEAGGLAVDARLLDAEGGHLRQLSQQGRGTITFQDVTQDATTLLRIEGAQAGKLGLRLDRIVPPADQQPPAPAYLSPRMTALAATLRAGGDSAAFWREIEAQGTPLVEDEGGETVIVTFLWRGAARNVRLFGGPSGDHEWLDRLDDSDVWFRSFEVPRAMRLSYRLAPDVPDFDGSPLERRRAVLATAQADPLNRHPWPEDAPDRFNRSSTVTLADAPDQPGTPPSAEADPVVTRFAFDSAILGNSREIVVSHPRGLDLSDPRLVVALITDGERAADTMDAPRMLDSLTRDGRLPPVLAVLIPSIDNTLRARELPDNPAFADALADELLPELSRRLEFTPQPSRTVIAGVSYGGLAAATVALARSDRIGAVLSMSGSFWWRPEGSAPGGLPHVAAQYAARETLPIRFFLSAGTFEAARTGSRGIVETSLALRDVLRLGGYPVTWREYAGGHDYLVWRGALADGMIALFGNPSEPAASGSAAEATGSAR